MLSQKSGPTYYARLQFEDAASCVAWLETIPLGEIIEAHEMVAAQVGLLTRAELPSLERLRVLELLYLPAAHLQAELARGFFGRALPHSIVEYSAWMSVLELWHVLYKGYQACLRRALRGDQSLAQHAPLVLLRCIELTVAAIREHHHAYREVAGTLWRQLHECYAIAERLQVQSLRVADPLRPDGEVRTAAGVYLQALLAHHANPYTMSLRQMQFMYRWAGDWAALATISVNPPAPGVAPPLAVDVRSGVPMVSARDIEVSPSTRYIDLDRFGQAVRHVIAALRRGGTPDSVGLGNDCNQPGCEQLLTLLYIQWCGTGIGPFARPIRERGEDVRACIGIDAVLSQIHAGAEAGRAPAGAIGMAFNPCTEHWNITSASAPGFLSVARGPECDQRLEHNQLIGIKRRAAASFQLGVVQWLKLEGDGDLSIGLRMLAGAPQVVALRLTDTQASTVAVMLPPSVERQLPATLVLRKDMFREGREVDVLSLLMRRVRLTRIAEQGADFERVAFELMP
jgi:hypothetical protein